MGIVLVVLVCSANATNQKCIQISQDSVHILYVSIWLLSQVSTNPYSLLTDLIRIQMDRNTYGTIRIPEKAKWTLSSPPCCHFLRHSVLQFTAILIFFTLRYLPQGPLSAPVRQQLPEASSILSPKTPQPRCPLLTSQRKYIQYCCFAKDKRLLDNTFLAHNLVHHFGPLWVLWLEIDIRIKTKCLQIF